MPGRNLFVLCLGVLASLHLSSGQSMWGGSMPGQGSGLWGRQDFWGGQQQDETAVCTAMGSDGGLNLDMEVTIKSASNGWFGRSLELDISVMANNNNDKKYSIVMTKYGATGNQGGCTNDNLGSIVTRRTQFVNPWFPTTNNGVIGTVDFDGGQMFSDTFSGNDLPISSVQDAWGSGLALCEDVEEEETADTSPGWGWGMQTSFHRQQPTYVCHEPIPICCHFGKFDGDAQI